MLRVSEDLKPARIWGLAAVLVIGFMVSYELFWRANGFKAWAYRDDADFFGEVLHSVPEDDPKVLVLAGSSRTHCDLVAPVLSEHLGVPVFQLGKPHGTPLPVLRHLATRTDFKGVILCEIMPTNFFREGDYNSYGTPEDWIQWYESRLDSPSAQVERILRPVPRAVLVARLPELNLLTLMADFPRFKWPVAETEHMIGPDRLKQFECEPEEGKRKDAAAAKLWRKERPPAKPEALEPFYEEAWRLAGLIQKRGGQVIFFSMPSSGESRKVEQELYPRRDYLDRFMQTAQGPVLDWEAYPELQGFECADGTHLLFPLAQDFSAKVAAIVKPVVLERGGLVPPAGS